MLRAVELRAEGLSLREIARRLLCSYQTVANDIARWQREHENVVSLSNAPVKSVAPEATDLTPVFDGEDPNVISLSDRRKRA